MGGEMQLHKNLLLFAGITLSATIVVVFQNCSPKGFKVVSAEPSIPLSSNTPPPASENTTLFEINPNFANSTLSASGLLEKMDQKNFANFKEYEPQYPLFSDGATKRRFIYIPKGEQIDTSDPDQWRYPRGTIFWKEFSIEGKRVETRAWEKLSQGTGPSSWRPSLYLWRADQSEADLLTVNDFYTKPLSERQLYQAGLIEDKYKLVTNASCVGCHQSGVDVPLGFNYFQLSKKELNVNIYSLVGQNLMTVPLLVEDQIRGSQKARDAIGYMQNNCATCHNGITQKRNFRHSSKNLFYSDEAIVKEFSIPGKSGDMPLITFGDLNNSWIYQRILKREMPRTNPIIADPHGLSVIGAWILENSEGNTQ
jgi:hypothetical protein